MRRFPSVLICFFFAVNLAEAQPTKRDRELPTFLQNEYISCSSSVEGAQVHGKPVFKPRGKSFHASAVVFYPSTTQWLKAFANFDAYGGGVKQRHSDQSWRKPYPLGPVTCSPGPAIVSMQSCSINIGRMHLSCDQVCSREGAYLEVCGKLTAGATPSAPPSGLVDVHK